MEMLNRILGRSVVPIGILCGLRAAVRRMFQRRSRELTYDDALGVIVSKRPPGQAMAKALLVRRRDGHGIRLAWMFLDNCNRVCPGKGGGPYIYQLWVRSLDRELEDLFGDKDLVVFT